MGRPDDKGIAGKFLFADVGGLLIVADVAHIHGLDDIGITAHGEVNERQCAALFFYESQRLREDDDVSTIPAALHGGQRNAVRDASVKKLIAVHFHDAGDERHGRGGAEVLHIFLVAVVQALMDGLSGLYVGADRIEDHRVVFIGFHIEGIQFVGDFVVAELNSVEVAGLDEGLDAAVSGISAEPHVVAERAADLPGLEVAAEYGTGGDAHGAVKRDAVFHHHI